MLPPNTVLANPQGEIKGSFGARNIPAELMQKNESISHIPNAVILSFPLGILMKLVFHMRLIKADLNI